MLKNDEIITSRVSYPSAITLFTDAHGQPSMMRLIAFAGAIVGGGTVVCAVVGWLAGHGAAGEVVAMAGIGAGLFGGSELFKTIQKRFEK